MTFDTLDMGICDSAQVVRDEMERLEGQGWRNMKFNPYVSDSSRHIFSDSVSASITGERPMTEAKFKKKAQIKAKLRKKDDQNRHAKRRKEKRVLKRLAKKHNYTLVKN